MSWENPQPSEIAPIGQYRTHLPHLIHLSMSAVGALNRTCDNASTGQTRTEGQGWFSGQRLRLTRMTASAETGCFSSGSPPKNWLQMLLLKITPQTINFL